MHKSPSSTVGSIDVPATGSLGPDGDLLTVAGWAIVDGCPADEIECVAGDLPPRKLRRGLPRPDLTGLASEFSTAMAGGFAGWVPIQEGWRGHEIVVEVRAKGTHGGEWAGRTMVRIPPAAPAAVTIPTDLNVQRAEPGASDADEPLRLTVFTHSLNLGGGELYLSELLFRWIKDGRLDVTVVSPAWGPLGDDLREAGIRVHVNGGYRIAAEAYEGGVTELRALLLATRAQAVVVNTLGIFPGVDAALRSGLPVLWAIHESFELTEFIHLNWGAGGLAPEVRSRFVHCLEHAETIFEAVATLELFRAQVPALRGRVIRYGIEGRLIDDYVTATDRAQIRAEEGFAPHDRVLLCMGVYQERKAQCALVEAFSRVASANPNAQLVMVGAHPTAYTAAVISLIAALGLTDRVRVLPIQRDTYRWYLIADILVSASDIESLPRSILEAKAFGLPVLATDVFGVGEVILDGEDGWLCRPSSGDALAAGLARVLSVSDDELRRIAEVGRSEASQHEGENYRAAYDELVRRLVANNQAERAGQ